MKWVTLKNVLGLPHKVDLNTMEQIVYNMLRNVRFWRKKSYICTFLYFLHTYAYLDLNIQFKTGSSQFGVRLRTRARPMAAGRVHDPHQDCTIAAPAIIMLRHHMHQDISPECIVVTHHNTSTNSSCQTCFLVSHKSCN